MLCCIGDLVEDVVVWPTAAPKRGTDTVSHVFRRRGGSAANVAVLAVEDGGHSRFIGQVGDDRLVVVLAAEMADCGVDVQIAKGGRTGTIVVLIESDGERTMLPDRGAALQLEAIPDGALDGVAWLHVPGYSLIAEPLGTTSRGLIDSARAAGIPVSIDASSTGLLQGFGTARFEEELRAIQPEILFCNQEEAELLGVDREHPFPGAGLSVIKAGPDPVLLVEPSRVAAEVPVPRVENVTDTTGAGDAFAAGYLVAKINGAAPVEAAVAGIELAATVLSRPGAGEHDH